MKKLCSAAIGISLLLASAPAFADEVRIEWAPAPQSEVSEFVLERSQAGAWHEVARVRNDVSDPRFDKASGRFVVPASEDAPAPWRLFAVDAVGNVSAPQPVQPQMVACVWRVAGREVPVVCLEACSCSHVLRSLEEAKALMVRENLCSERRFEDEARLLTAVAVSDEAYLRRMCPGAPEKTRGCYGSNERGDRLLILRPQADAGFHEAMHLCRGLNEDHSAWERSPRIQELDLRFQEERRGGKR
jgi:hypothetical protein